MTEKVKAWHAEIQLSKMTGSIASIRFSPVQEWVTWFDQQERPNISQLFFVDPAKPEVTNQSPR